MFMERAASSVELVTLPLLLRRGVHRSTRELEHAIRHYIDTVNADPRPFRWTKSTDDILDTIKRFCLRTLDTAQRQTGIIRTSESGH